MAKTYNDFKTKVMGKGYDIDGSFGNQCWDGYAKYCEYLGYPYASCTSTGYARDIWNNRKTNGSLNYFNESSTPSVGAIIIYDVATKTPYSHIGVVDSFDKPKGILNVLGQNQGGVNGAFNLANIGYNGVLGYLVPKCFTPTKNIGYTCHVQDDGWQSEKFDGATGGTTGKSKRLEAFKIRTLSGGTIEYVKVYIQGTGWKSYKTPTKSTVIGTTGKGKRLESIAIKLKGFKFRVHIQDKDWTSWKKCDGSILGLAKSGKRIEAIQVKKG